MTEKKQTREEKVTEYLLENRDFLKDHPEILTEMELPHEAGEAVSLIERQVGQLREQNQKLTGQLNQLIRVATDNEALMHRLHELTLELMVIADLLHTIVSHSLEDLWFLGGIVLIRTVIETCSW